MMHPPVIASGLASVQVILDWIIPLEPCEIFIVRLVIRPLLDLRLL